MNHRLRQDRQWRRETPWQSVKRWWWNLPWQSRVHIIGIVAFAAFVLWSCGWLAYLLVVIAMGAWK